MKQQLSELIETIAHNPEYMETIRAGIVRGLERLKNVMKIKLPTIFAELFVVCLLIALSIFYFKSMERENADIYNDVQTSELSDRVWQSLGELERE